LEGLKTEGAVEVADLFGVNTPTSLFNFDVKADLPEAFLGAGAAAAGVGSTAGEGSGC